MEQETMQNENPSYWASVLIGALVITLITTIIGTFLLYYIAGAEPSPMLLILLSSFVIINCLFGSIGGFISTRHYAKTFNLTFPIGKGALIGLLTGIVGAILAAIIGQLWNLIDPALVDNLIANITDVMDMIDMSQQQRDETLSSIVESFESSQTFGGIIQGVLINSAILGVVNAISGLIGAKVFASED